MVHHPMPAYHFTVEWGGTNLNFLEVSGLSISVDVTEFRDGADPQQTAHKIPGHSHFSNIILRRNISKGDNDFFTWMNKINLGQVERRDILIRLLNVNHEPVISWRAENAFPVKLSGPVLNANASDMAIEELELTHEGLRVELS